MVSLNAQGRDVVAPPKKQDDLNDDGKILYEAYQAFSKNGMTTDEKKKLDSIDETLTDASIQLTKNGGAVITDSNGKSVSIEGR